MNMEAGQLISLDRIIGRLGVACALSACAFAVAPAQEYATTQRGSLTMAGDEVSPELTPAQRRAGLQAADALLALLKKTELFRDLSGVSVSAWREVNIERGGWQTGRPFSYGVGASVSYLVWNQDGKGGRGIENGPTLHVEIRVNGTPCVPSDNDGVVADSGAPVSESRDNGARVTGQFRGRPIYDGSCVFFTGGSASPSSRSRRSGICASRLHDCMNGAPQTAPA